MKYVIFLVKCGIQMLTLAFMLLAIIDEKLLLNDEMESA